MDVIRAFIGHPLPRECQDSLARLREELAPLAPARLSWTRPGNWHLTLKFLGDVSKTHEYGLKGVVRALSGLPWKSFPLQAGDAGYFPGAASPRVVWVGIAKGNENCARLAQQVEEVLAPLGFPGQSRPFSPHLTVARVRQGGRDRFQDGPGGGPFAARPSWATFAARLAKAVWPPVTISRLTLWQSVLGPGGPKYLPLAEFPARD